MAEGRRVLLRGVGGDVDVVVAVIGGCVAQESKRRRRQGLESIGCNVNTTTTIITTVTFIILQPTVQIGDSSAPLPVPEPLRIRPRTLGNRSRRAAVAVKRHRGGLATTAETFAPAPLTAAITASPILTIADLTAALR